jgi:hypothetical protein
MVYFDPTYGPQMPAPRTPTVSMGDVLGFGLQSGDPRSRGPRQGDISLDAPAAPAVAPRPAAAPPMPRPEQYAGGDDGAGYQVPGTFIGRQEGVPAGQYMNSPRLAVEVDRSRGTSGADWARSQAPAPAIPTGGGSGYMFSGNGTQADLEGRANMRRMLDAAYGPSSPAFDPYQAQIEDFDNQSALKVAELRAKDPVAFATAQAAIPQQAKVRAQMQAGTEFGGVLGKFLEERNALDDDLQRLRAHPKYLASTPEQRAQAEAGFERRASQIDQQVETLKQAMGIMTGSAPGALFQQRGQLGGGGF